MADLRSGQLGYRRNDRTLVYSVWRPSWVHDLRGEPSIVDVGGQRELTNGYDRTG